MSLNEQLLMLKNHAAIFLDHFVYTKTYFQTELNFQDQANSTPIQQSSRSPKKICYKLCHKVKIQI